MARTPIVKGAPHVKIVISALSLAATLGGWANLTLAESTAQSEAAKSRVMVAVAPTASTVAVPGEFAIELPVMPTITPLKVPVVATPMPVVAKPIENPVPVVAVAQPAAEPTVAAPTTLRVVSAPRPASNAGPDRGGGGGGGAAVAPPPAATTKSSK